MEAQISKSEFFLHNMANFEGDFGPSKSPVARNFVRLRARCTRSKSNMADFKSDAQRKVRTSQRNAYPLFLCKRKYKITLTFVSATFLTASMLMTVQVTATLRILFKILLNRLMMKLS